MMRQSTRGFTLIEVTVAVAIIGILIAATGALLARIPVGGREVRDQDLALRIARNKIETLRASGYAALPVSGSFADTLLSSLAAGTTSLMITSVNAKTKQVEVSVSWRGAGSSTRSVSLTTLITEDNGL